MKKNILRHFLCGAVTILFLMSFFHSAATADEAPGALRLPFRDLTAAEITEEMGLGWNLGNTMDGHSAFMPSETAWQGVVTSSELIDAVHDAGFNTVRIPVTWGLKIDDENNYTIDAEWMNRVREITEYALRQDMYVIINIHHDGAEQTGWLRVAYEGGELEMVKEKFGRVWQQIAQAFAGCDEHVIFESMNEVKSGDDTKEGVKRDFRVIGELNQIFVDTVRVTGGNNARRWLLVPGRYTNIVNTTNEDNGFSLPDDPWNAENRLMVSVHDYDYSFGLLDTMGITSWSEDSAKKMAANFQKLIDWFTSKEIPVVLGEYGASNKNNTEARTYYYEVMARLSRVSGVVCCAWDNGWYDKTKEPADYSMALFDRATKEQIYPEIIQGILRGHFFADESKGVNDINSIVRGTKDNRVETIPVASISFSAHTLSLAAGSWAKVAAEALPEDSNEAVVYSTSDPYVATVYNGLVRAKGIGRCTVTASSISGGAKEQIEVTVYPNENLEMPLQSFETDADAYTVSISDFKRINMNIPDGTDDVASFISTDTNIVTVGSLGTLTGKSTGTAWVVMTSRSGLVKKVRIDVVPAVSSENSLEIAINAYYNDSEHSFFNNCRGESVVVSGNGTYTLTFDCEEHLTKEAAEAGVTSLNGVGAIYLADVEGRNGLLASCDIFYNEVLLDGTALTITQTEPKTALKTGDRFDTNDPVNAWDGSSVAEAAADDYVISFEGYPAPKTITVTFTLSDFVLAKDAEDEPTEETIPASILLAEEEVILETAQSVPFSAALSPKDTTDTVCFVSDNPKAVWVSSQSIKPNKNGNAEIYLVPLGAGDAIIKVTAQSGDSKELKVISAADIPAFEGTINQYTKPSEYVLTEPTPEPTEKVKEVSPTPEPEVTPEPAIIDEPEKDKDGPSLAVLILIGLAGGAAVLTGIIFAVRAYMRKK